MASWATVASAVLVIAVALAGRVEAAPTLQSDLSTETAATTAAILEDSTPAAVDGSSTGFSTCTPHSAEPICVDKPVSGHFALDMILFCACQYMQDVPVKSWELFESSHLGFQHEICACLEGFQTDTGSTGAPGSCATFLTDAQSAMHCPIPSENDVDGSGETANTRPQTEAETTTTQYSSTSPFSSSTPTETLPATSSTSPYTSSEDTTSSATPTSEAISSTETATETVEDGSGTTEGPAASSQAASLSSAVDDSTGVTTVASAASTDVTTAPVATSAPADTSLPATADETSSSPTTVSATDTDSSGPNEVTTPEEFPSTTFLTAPAPTSTTQKTPCVKGQDNCSACEASGQACIRCKNGQYLLEGKCVATCPAEYNSQGLGDFGRQCLLRTTTTAPPQVCIKGQDNCNTCDIDNLFCVRCKNAHFLFLGICVETCPANFEGQGKGDFDRKCVAATASTTPAPVCTKSEDNCNTCDASNQFCIRCKNERYLHQGKCIDACPADFVGQGNGDFGRRCVAVTTTAAPVPVCVKSEDDCNTCDAGNQFCIRCKNERYLHQGKCIDACPADFVGQGKGAFDRKCVAVTTTAAPVPVCVKSQDNCNACDAGNQFCIRCKNERYLHQGKCIDACPLGFQGFGQGDFFRECKPIAPCVKGQDQCNTCSADNSVCEVCKNARYLHMGVCMDACPAGFSPAGAGNFGRFCEPGCIQGDNDCSRCDEAATTCLRCKNFKFLYSGVCVDTCPELFVGRGSGRFDRTCVPL